MGVFCILAWFAAPVASQEPKEKTEVTPMEMAKAFRGEYAAATDDKTRRNRVLKALDEKVLHTGQSIAEVRELFGDDLRTNPRDKDGAVRGIVHFEPPRHPPKPLMSAAVWGWYIELTFDTEDKLVKYALSDVYKAPYK